jgi:DNA polymerase-4
MLSLQWLYLDMNAYFASAEQQMQPSLRGKPVAVVPMKTDRTCCIAASYEARAYGVRTGTNVGEARRLCPGLRLVEGRHERYVELHHQIIAAVETVLPVEKVWSIDEVACRLSPQHRYPAPALLLAGEVKHAVATHVGPYMRCSVGLAPNRFLAKVAAGMQKPDGLTLIAPEDLPHRLYGLDLSDLPGIGRNMRRRLESNGVLTVRHLCGLSQDTLKAIWRSKVGEVWWRWLRGEDLPDPPTKRGSVGHSHVLPPKLRTDDGSRAVLVRLLHKAAARLRRLGYWAGRMDTRVSYLGEQSDWRVQLKLGGVQDTSTLLRAFDAAWRGRPSSGRPLKVSVTLYHLTADGNMTLPLFGDQQQAISASRVMDAVNAQLGPTALYFASMHSARQAAPLRIAFTNIPDVPIEGARAPGPGREGPVE